MLDKAPNKKLSDLLATFGAALEAGDIDAAVGLFQDDCYWRDLVTFTWNIRTMEGRDQIRDMLKSQLAATKPSNWSLAEGEDATEADGVIEGWISFETDVARGFGHIRLKSGMIWTLLTTMVELKGHEERPGFARPMGAKHGAATRPQDLEGGPRAGGRRTRPPTQPYCLIIGGGQGGIALGARLSQLGVPTIIVEKNERPGDSWRKRYKSLCLHDPVWYDHLPYIPFPKNWPVFSPKDKIGDWLEMYTKVMELNYWASTDARAPAMTRRRRMDGRGRPRRRRRSCCGQSSWCLPPACRQSRTCRSSRAWTSSRASSTIRRAIPAPTPMPARSAVVIGSNNSAHDICAALWEAGADVTMVQRSSTHIVEVGFADGDRSRFALFRAGGSAGMTTEKADLIFASVPYRILHEFQIPIYEAIRERDADFYKRLEKAGFMLDWGDDGSGLFMKYLRRGSGYYIDVGASELIADGTIKLKSGSDVQELTENSVILKDGTELPADLVVYATGYGSMNGWAAELISKDVADKVGKVLGPRLEHRQGSRPLGRRAAQHVEADPAGRAVVPRRQPAPVAALFAIPVVAAQGAHGGHPHAGLRTAAGSSSGLRSLTSVQGGSGRPPCIAAPPRLIHAPVMKRC